MIKNISIYICLIFGASSSSAALVSNDLFTPGDGLLTWDNSRGLEWLDLSATYGKSNSYINNSSWGSRGFRHATNEDLIGLFTSAGLDIGLGLAEYPEAIQLQELLGVTFGAPGSGSSVGYVAPRINRYGNEVYPYSALFTNASEQEYAMFFDLGTSLFSTDTIDGGHFLIRDAAVVPVPAAVWLFASGLLGLIGVVRSHR